MISAWDRPEVSAAGGAFTSNNFSDFQRSWYFFSNVFRWSLFAVYKSMKDVVAKIVVTDSDVPGQVLWSVPSIVRMTIDVYNNTRVWMVYAKDLISISWLSSEQCCAQSVTFRQTIPDSTSPTTSKLPASSKKIIMSKMENDWGVLVDLQVYAIKQPELNVWTSYQWVA